MIFKIQKIVLRTLSDLDLDVIRDLTVGDPLNKFISGGQRKRLNIALALYSGKTSQFIEILVKFEDGRRSKVAADLQIRDARTFPASVKKAA